MLQITFRNMLSSASLSDLAHHKFSHLERQLRGSWSCALVLENQPEHVRREQQFRAHVDLRLGTHQALHANAEAEHAAVAVREVFAMLERQLASRDLHGQRSTAD